jgi:hypothetical protein
MAYQTVSDQYGGRAQQPLTAYPHLEPETIVHDSDDSSVDPTSALGGKRIGELDGRGGVVKRAMSTPDVRGLGVEGVALSAADKKRNKLGYHRTAVACGRQIPGTFRFWTVAHECRSLSSTQDTMYRRVRRF